MSDDGLTDSWGDRPMSELDDAIIEDTVHCKRCDAPWDITDTYGVNGRSVCPDCVQDEIDEREEILKGLLAACECQAVWEQYMHDPNVEKFDEMVVPALSRHGFAGSMIDDAMDFIDSLRDMALAKIRGTTP